MPSKHSENENVSEDALFWRHVWSAVQRIVAFLILAGLHKLIDYVLRWVTPANFAGAVVYLEDVVFVAFGMVYIYLIWDVVTVFIPALRRKSYPFQEEAREAE